MREVAKSGRFLAADEIGFFPANRPAAQPGVWWEARAGMELGCSSLSDNLEEPAKDIG